MKLTLTIFLFVCLLRALVQGQCDNAITVSAIPFAATGSIGIDSPLVVATGAGTCFPQILEGFTRGDWYEIEGTGKCIRVNAIQQGEGLLFTAIAIYLDEGADCNGISCQTIALVPGIAIAERVMGVNENYKVLVTGIGAGNYQVSFEVSELVHSSDDLKLDLTLRFWELQECTTTAMNGTAAPYGELDIVLPSGQVCQGFEAAEIEYENAAATIVDTIETSIQCYIPPSIGSLNMPSDATVTLVPVADTEPLAVYTRPPGFVTAFVSTSGTLSFRIGSNLSAAGNVAAGIIAEVPQSQLMNVKMGVGVFTFMVQILGGFSALVSIVDDGINNELQATLTSSVSAQYIIGSWAVAKIESTTSDFDFISSGINADIQISGNVGTGECSSEDLVLVQGRIGSIVATGIGNEIRVNDPTGGGCLNVDLGHSLMDNTCTITDEIVTLTEIPCTPQAVNLVCTGSSNSCSCSPSQEGVTVPTEVPTELPTESPTTQPTDSAAENIDGVTVPTELPTASPTTQPTDSATENVDGVTVPTELPTESPTTQPTDSATENVDSDDGVGNPSIEVDSTSKIGFASATVIAVISWAFLVL